jgi:hypothetical protein
MKRFAARAAVLLLGLGTVTACGTTTSTNGSNGTSNVNSSQTSQVSSQSGSKSVSASRLIPLRSIRFTQVPGSIAR